MDSHPSGRGQTKEGLLEEMEHSQSPQKSHSKEQRGTVWSSVLHPTLQKRGFRGSVLVDE